MYEVSESYFRRKIPKILEESSLGIYYLIAKNLLTHVTDYDFSRISDFSMVKRYCRVGSNIVSLLVYKNFGLKPIRLDLLFAELANVEAFEVGKDDRPRFFERTKPIKDSCILQSGDLRTIFLIHTGTSFSIKVEEKAEIDQK